MSARLQQLAMHRARLQLRCAAQREAVAQLMQNITQPAQSIDHGIARLREFAKRPVVLAVGAALLFLVGPRRILRLAGKSWLLIAAARRLLNR